MREFAKVLSRLLTEQGITQAQLAQFAHMDDAKISRLINSVNRPSVEDVAAFLGSFHDPQIKFRLAVAHIQDELPPEMFERLQIQLADKASPMSEAMAYILRESPDSQETENVIVGFAKLMGFEPPKPVKYPRPTHGLKTGIARKAVQIIKKAGT